MLDLLSNSFADYIVLLSHLHNDTQIKATRIASTSKSIALEVNARETKAIRVNANKKQPIQIYDEDVEDVQDFT